MQFCSCVFISGSQEAGIEWHKMEQSLSRFVTPVEVGQRVKNETISLET
jgi:hypothetical protein